MPVVYCAPARRPFHRLHIAEDGADFHAPEGCEGLTVCGLIMASDDLWVPVNPHPGEAICRDCTGQPARVEHQLTFAGSSL